MSTPSNPDATLVAFVYDERPTLNLMRSLLRDARRWPNLAIWDQSKDALISRSRSTAATHFLEQGAGDVLLMVDHDIGWEPGDLEHLTRVCLDQIGIVGGVYSKRGFRLGVPIRFGQWGEYDVPDDRIVECAYVATGFIAIHRSVLMRMAEELPRTIHGFVPFFETKTVEREAGVEYLSEDYAFCERARALGFRVWADLRPQLTHMGTHLFTVADTSWRPPVAKGPTTLRQLDPEKPATVPGLGGGTFELYVDPDDDTICAGLIRGEAWEMEVLEALAREIRGEDTVVEVGAHVGYDTVQLARLPARYIAVEPIPHLATLLRKNIELAGVGAEVWQAAIVRDDDYRKSARMLRDLHNPGASRLLLEEDNQGIEVATVRLPDLADRIDVLKLDAEGAEFEMLAGPRAAEALRHTRLIVTEYCEAQLEAVSGVSGRQYLERLGELGFEHGIEDLSKLPSGKAYCNLLLRRRECLAG